MIIILKYSKQREAIKSFLVGRYDHPTAETVYLGIKQEFPNISLGTVYRNLSLLSDIGEIQKLSTGIGPDRFDGNAAPHYHFICTRCGRVLDIDLDQMVWIISTSLPIRDLTVKLKVTLHIFMGNAQTVKRTVNGTVPVVLRTVQLSIKNIRKSIDKIYFLN